MILQALKEYYDRKAADPDSEIAPYGWEYKAIPFVIVLDNDGNLIQIEDTREGARQTPRIFLVPKSEPRTFNIEANVLWDKAEYIFSGIEVKKASDKALERRQAFKNQLTELFSEIRCIISVLKFLQTITSERLAQERCWEDIKKDNPLLSFRIQGDLGLICHRPEVESSINARNRTLKVINGNEKETGICLVTGDFTAISRITNKTFINRKNNSLVSFQKNSGYDSYGKEQGYNAPISKQAEFAYVTALNTLLKSKRQKFSVGDGIYVCWSAQKTHFETQFTMFFDDGQTTDDPDLYSDNVKAALQSIHSGAFVQDEASHLFYILGLSPGGGTRISVRFWDVNTVGEYARNIGLYFQDITIQKPHYLPEHLSLSQLLSNIAQQGDRDRIPPNLAGDVMRAIITNKPFPVNMLHSSIRRIRAGIKKRTRGGVDKIDRVTPQIASVIKGYLNRYYRCYPNNNYKEVGVQLDKDQTSTGYQLGRLFAVLEKIQEEANPGLNSTITERFYGAACSTPVAVFSNLLKLKNHHLAKLNNKSRFVFFDRLLGEIINNINDFPPHLDLHEQGLFAIGYYHQRQTFFQPKSKNNNPE